MRLSDYQKNAIIEAFEPYLKGMKAELRLHGSRTDDSKKGGDIDLLLVLFSPENTDEIRKKKINILIDITQRVGEQKVDITITNQNEMKDDPFLEMIFPKSVVLRYWQ